MMIDLHFVCKNVQLIRHTLLVESKIAFYCTRKWELRKKGLGKTRETAVSTFKRIRRRRQEVVG